MSKHKPNRLINEKSLYLRQHAYNPVDWFPWSEEAFELAQEKDCPVFLSIGYSSCHWCHVMEKESFENEEIAEILNENFVSIKVDREEHPDVDNFYMTFVTSTTGSGGWPLSVFLFPDKTPFFGGTYFPPTPKFGKPSFKDILLSVLSFYKNKRDELNKIKADVNSFLMKSFSPELIEDEITKEKIQAAYQTIINNYDWSNGGWGKGAKFPMFPILNFLIDYYSAFDDINSLKIVEHNLTKILTGGIYDHLDGGIHRYTVDNNWIVPHFEKMLYDNAQLIEVLSKYLILNDNSFFRSRLIETINFLMNEMRDVYGGYFTALDADSEGEEGKYYLWNFDELKRAIEEKFDVNLFFEYYQFNLIDQKNGIGNISLKKIPNQNDSILLNELSLVLKHLREKRAQRVFPSKDNKILLDLNSLLISAFCFAYRATQDERFLFEALNIYDFITQKMMVDQELYHSYVEGELKIEAYSDDYFGFIQALVDLYECTFDEKFLIEAFKFNQKALQLFYDSSRNLIYQQSQDCSLPFRTSENKDYSKPSSTSLALSVLFKLGKIFEDDNLIETAKKIIKKNLKEAIDYPFGTGKFLSAALNELVPPKELILVEGEDNSQFNFFKGYLLKSIYPSQIILYKKKKSTLSFSYMKDKSSIDSKLTLFICENFACQKPIVEMNESTH
ncbi:MAG: thioredoxin domain-containing protein [Ignavibacteria bacterium]|nr:thioredoxin domain-containing protein [Ignavibacteria bacterium]